MPIEFSKPSKDKPPSRSATHNAGEGSAAPVVYQKDARAPRGLKAVYVHVLTEARLTQAAAELGLNKNEMANDALMQYLKREAAALFEREFQEADQNSPNHSIHRHEFMEKWRAPSWSREN